VIDLSPWGRKTDRLFDALAIAILVAVTVIVALTFKDYGLGWDDYTQAQYGDLLYRLYATGFSDRSALSFVNLYAYGGGFDLAADMLAKWLPFDLFETRRLLGGLVGLLGLAITWRTSRRIAGPLAGVLALAMLAACPPYYGHMFINCKDAPFAVAMMLTILGLVRAFQEYPSPSWPTRAILWSGFGLAFGSRVLGGFAGIEAACVLAVLVLIEAKRDGTPKALARAREFIVALAPGLVLAYAVMALIWPWSVVEPLNPVRATAYFSTFFEVPWRELFEGHLIRVPDMPRRYLPELLALTLPEIFVVLSVLGLGGCLTAAFRRWLPSQQRATLLLIASASLLPILIVVAIRPAMYNGIRHFVFLMPPLAVAAGIAGSFIVTRLARRSQVLGVAALALLFAALVPPVSVMAALHPYEYVYFNAFAGGPRGARTNYMLDYWGLSFKQATAALRAKLAADHAQPPGGKWHIATCGPQWTAHQELGDDFIVSWDTKGADFALMLGVYYCRELDAPIIAEIKRDGVVFARVYDLRGRSVPDLLAVTPP
jgi:hypothetical protein